ncbi:hypothetical protein MRB53_034580 [Persea americana]|uniref:Uncharacterized protein n=1 Tax=Persea americana TaxID=3435 RepID=A0ACC2K2P2_PERAE|nr:hypothetical protein MRB53_034580 [Persea americana]
MGEEKLEGITTVCCCYSLFFSYWHKLGINTTPFAPTAEMAATDPLDEDNDAAAEECEIPQAENMGH